MMLRGNWETLVRRVVQALGAWGKPFPILNLPVDLVYAIFDKLSPADVLSVALSCKSLYKTCPASAVNKLTMEGKTDLLQRLERDLGDRYTFCSVCVKLHAFKKDPKAQVRDVIRWEERPSGGIGFCCPGVFTPLCLWAHGSRDLNYQMARLLLNNHLYGAKKGISAGKFCRGYRRSPTPPSQRNLWHVKFNVKFVNNQLLLKATHRIHGTSMTQLMQNEETREHQLCAHMLAVSYGESSSLLGLESAMIITEEGYLRTGARRCHTCLADWRIASSQRVSRHSKEIKFNKISVTIQSYHLLGDLSGHDEPVWRLAARDDWVVPTDEMARLYLKYTDGSIRKMWGDEPSGSAIIRYR